MYWLANIVSPPRAGLSFSVLLRPAPAVPVQHWSWLPLLAGVALARAVGRLAQVEAVLKWPNDLLLGERRRKAAGLLIQGEAGAVVLGMPSLHEALVALGQRNIRSLFVEGGPKLAGSFLSEGLVDRLIIFRAPVVLGNAAPKAFAHAPAGFAEMLGDERHAIVDERRFGDDTMTVYALREVPCSPV